MEVNCCEMWGVVSVDYCRQTDQQTNGAVTLIFNKQLLGKVSAFIILMYYQSY